MSDEKQTEENRPFHREGEAFVLETPRDLAETRRQTRETELHEFARVQVTTNKRLVVLTSCLAVCSVCGLVLGGWQASISERAVDSSDKSVLLAQRSERDARKATDEQARQSAKTLQSDIENFQRDQRPWVMIKYMQISVTKQDVGATLGGQIVMTNSGKSPAFDLTVTNAGIQSDPGRLDINSWLLTHRQSTTLAKATPLAVMAPTDPYIIPYEEIKISKDTADDISSRKLWVYIFGDVHYTDSFGYRHFTQYCGLYDPKHVTVNFCTTHIFADRDK